MSRVLAVLAGEFRLVALHPHDRPAGAGDRERVRGRTAHGSVTLTVFAIPWALSQPLLGPVGDLVGKTRVILTCLFILFSVRSWAFSRRISLLMASRIVAGMAAGGVFPVSVALFGDLVPVAERQVRMGSLLAWSITGTLLGAVTAGFLGDVIHWRWIFALYGLTALAAFAGAALALRGVPSAPPRALRVGAMIESHRRVWSNPRAVVCYGAVFTEGIVMIGLFPFVAVLLVSIGETRASIAGVVLAAFLSGGIAYSLAVGRLVKRFSPAILMTGGGLHGGGTAGRGDGAVVARADGHFLRDGVRLLHASRLDHDLHDRARSRSAWHGGRRARVLDIIRVRRLGRWSTARALRPSGLPRLS